VLPYQRTMGRIIRHVAAATHRRTHHLATLLQPFAARRPVITTQSPKLMIIRAAGAAEASIYFDIFFSISSTLVYSAASAGQEDI